MTTVLEARKPDGSPIGRCDAKCHTATGLKCKCICRGLNHGLGGEHALDNDIFFMDREDKELIFSRPAAQRELFTRERDAATP